MKKKKKKRGGGKKKKMGKAYFDEIKIYLKVVDFKFSRWNETEKRKALIILYYFHLVYPSNLTSAILATFCSAILILGLRQPKEQNVIT